MKHLPIARLKYGDKTYTTELLCMGEYEVIVETVPNPNAVLKGSTTIHVSSLHHINDLEEKTFETIYVFITSDNTSSTLPRIDLYG